MKEKSITSDIGRSIYIERKECPPVENDIRCSCGKLLARITDNGIIIRCARCKRDMFLDLNEIIMNLDTGWFDIPLKEKVSAP